MRRLVLSIGMAVVLLGAAWAQSTGAGKSDALQLPVGQTYKGFQVPIYQDGQLKATLSSAEATGITLNRAEATDLKVDIYDHDKVTMTITSPKADLYIAERKMRTKNGVDINRNDMEATSQTCDFNLVTKKYLLRDNVKVVLKNFDTGLNRHPSAPAAAGADTSVGNALPTAAPAPSSTVPSNAMIDIPGAAALTNAAPTPMNGPVTP